MLESQGYGHQCATKQEHEEEISCTSSKRTLLQHAAVPVCEYHVEQKIESKRSKKHEVCKDSP